MVICKKYEVLVTFAEETRSAEYPLCVVVITDGLRGPEIRVRSLRDGLLVGNGLISGLYYAGVSICDFPANPTLDPRLKLDNWV